MNTLETLKALVAQLEAEQVQPEKPTTPKPRCDAQGRLLEKLMDGDTYYCVSAYGTVNDTWQSHYVDEGRLSHGNCFISKPAAEAELTRLKCLQRLRGMEGYIGLGNFKVWVKPHIVALSGFNTIDTAIKAEATINPEERAAFLYREPMGEK